ncbi:hypothetical protein GOODEAATRI_031600, partial [Goodea atripinnis]
EQSKSFLLNTFSKAQSSSPIITMFPDVHGATSMEMLVGSQKRKARKTKITHLVRTADGSVSPAEEARGAWLRARRKSLHKLQFSYPALTSKVLLLLPKEDEMNSSSEALLS